jgi:hypothetical protein
MLTIPHYRRGVFSRDFLQGAHNYGPNCEHLGCEHLGRRPKGRLDALFSRCAAGSHALLSAI